MADLVLSGRWELADVVADVARRRRVHLRAADPDGPAVLSDAAGRRSMQLPAGPALCGAVLEAVLASIGRCLTPGPVLVDGTVLRPAGGTCGPGRDGPVDAVRDAGTVNLQPGFRAQCKVLDVQHTRCWVASLMFTGNGPIRFRADPDVVPLPCVLTLDTARTCEYMLDRGDGYHWRRVVLANPPPVRPDGRFRALAMFTEGHFVDWLLRLMTARDRAVAEVAT